MSLNSFLSGIYSSDDTPTDEPESKPVADIDGYTQPLTVAMEHLAVVKDKLLRFMDMSDIYKEVVSAGGVSKQMALEANGLFGDRLLTGHLVSNSFTMTKTATNFRCLTTRMVGNLATESAALSEETEKLFTKLLIDARSAIESANQDYHPSLTKAFEVFRAECPESTWQNFSTIPKPKEGMAIIGNLRFSELTLYQLDKNEGAARSDLRDYGQFCEILGWKHVRLLLWLAAHNHPYSKLKEKESYAEAIQYEPTISEFCSCIASICMAELITKTLPDHAFEVLTHFDTSGVIRALPQKIDGEQASILVSSTGAIHDALHQAKEVLAMLYYANMLFVKAGMLFDIFKKYDV